MAKLPSQEDLNEIEQVLVPYWQALGRVAHTYNLMQEELGKLFCAVSELDQTKGMRIWYSLQSDRSQRNLLRGAIDGTAPKTAWKERHPDACARLIWLIKHANDLGFERDAAIHAPCYPLPGEKSFELRAITWNQSPLAQKVEKIAEGDILLQFAWYQNRADTLKKYARMCQAALASDGPFPETLRLPTLGEAAT